jgi:hypothetical protein
MAASTTSDAVVIPPPAEAAKAKYRPGNCN